MEAIKLESRKSKTQEIYKFLRRMIDGGEISVGGRLPTGQQISEMFNVSLLTAGRAFQKLVDEGLTFGLLIPGLGEKGIFETTCGQIANLANTYNFNLIWGGDSENDPSRFALKIASRYVEQKIDGLFFAPIETGINSQTDNEEIVEMFQKSGIPIVLLGGDILPSPIQRELDIVDVDNSEAGYIIGLHLLERGAQKIGFITAPNSQNNFHTRFDGIKKAMLELGLQLELIEMLDSPVDVEKMVGEIVHRRDLDALAIYNSPTASELCTALETHGVEIPNDLKIVAFDDVKYARFLKTPLTAYKLPFRDLGTAAVETMFSRIKNKQSCARRVLLHGQLVVRQST